MGRRRRLALRFLPGSGRKHPVQEEIPYLYSRLQQAPVAQAVGLHNEVETPSTFSVARPLRTEGGGGAVQWGMIWLRLCSLGFGEGRFGLQDWKELLPSLPPFFPISGSWIPGAPRAVEI